MDLLIRPDRYQFIFKSNPFLIFVLLQAICDYLDLLD